MMADRGEEARPLGLALDRPQSGAGECSASIERDSTKEGECGHVNRREAGQGRFGWRGAGPFRAPGGRTPSRIPVGAVAGLGGVMDEGMRSPEPTTDVLINSDIRKRISRILSVEVVSLGQVGCNGSGKAT